MWLFHTLVERGFTSGYVVFMEFLDYRRNRMTPCEQANIGIKNFSAIPHLIYSNSCRNVLYVLNVEQHRKRKNIFRLYCVIYSKTSPRDVRTFPLYCRLDSAAFVSVANSAKLRCRRQGENVCTHQKDYQYSESASSYRAVQVRVTSHFRNFGYVTLWRYIADTSAWFSRQIIPQSSHLNANSLQRGDCI